MGSSAIGARIEVRVIGRGEGDPLPTGGGALAGGCAPSPENASVFELKKASFGPFWMLFLQLN